MAEYMPNMDEIVFEHRNKDYGAYLLRKKYKKNMTIATLIGVFVMIFGVGVPTIMTAMKQDTKTGIENNLEVVMENVKQMEEEAPPPPPPPPPPPALEQQVKFTAPVVVDSVEEKVELASTEDIVQTTTNENVNTEPEIVEVKETKVVEDQEAMEVFMVVEEPPTYPGGDAELMKFISSNIKYPEIAKENNIQGKVFVQFVVEPNGKVSNVKVVRGVDPAIDKEAIRVIEQLPSWTPGKQRGKAVRVAFTVPINFKLQ